MKILQWLKERIRLYLASHGFTCDGCGAEIFDYPTHRLCERCEGAMQSNDGRTCEKCGRKTLAEGICLSCKNRLPKFTRGFSPFVYYGRSASFINQVKNGKPVLALYFAEKMADRFLAEWNNMVESAAKETLVVVPVPLTKERIRERGYNQAAELAEALCRRFTERGCEAELRTDILGKSRETAQQKHMGQASRLKNVAGAYHVQDRKACRGRTFLVVDDIMTTGATGSECASRLIAAGAKRVFFLVAASLPEQR